MRVLLDVDGVVADFLQHTISHVGEFAPEGGIESVTSWEILNHFPLPGRALAQKSWVEKGFCAGIPLYPGSLEGVSTVAKKAEIVWVTAPMQDSPYWGHERTLWLKRHFGAPHESVVLAHNKAHVWGDFLVDDRIENILSWCEAHPRGVGLLWDRPYNRHWNPGGVRFQRVSSWEQVLKSLE